jgi:transglutaminase-like putative cysteine protease
MRLLVNKPIEDYLRSSDVIDFEDIGIQQIASILSKDTHTDVDLAEKIYCFVRDRIKHSMDIQGSLVTCNASEVLKQQQGLCFAKSHLLAAILRYLKIPTGFCYQGVRMNDRVVLHGLNAIYLKSIDKWIRVDARGNKPNTNAGFSIAEEKLAYKISEDIGEFDSPVIYSKPDGNVIDALRKYKSLNELIKNLPTKFIIDN